MRAGEWFALNDTYMECGLVQTSMVSMGKWGFWDQHAVLQGGREGNWVLWPIERGGGGGLEWGSGVRSRGLLTYPPTYSPLQWTFHPLQPAAPDCATTHIGAALLCCLLQMLLTALLLASCLAYSLLTTFVAGEQFRVCPLRCRFPSLLIASFSHKHWIFFCVFSSICMLEMVR